MKNRVVKTVSVVLIIIMCFLMSVSAFAEDTEIKRTCPRVFVHGFMSYDVYADVDNPDSELAWPLPQEKILYAVKEALKPLAICAIDHDLDKLGNSLAPILDEVFASTCLDYNGEITNGSGIRFEYPSAESLNTESTVNFRYDWRLDPIVLASQLNDFINYVLENSGSEQVVLDCHSLGGVITTTYLKLYGNEKIKSVVFNSSAVYGETYTGELLKGEISVDSEGLKEFIKYCFIGSDYENTLAIVCEMLQDAGLLDFVIDFAGELLNGIYDEILLSVMKLFANWPTIWAMVPDEDVEAVKATVFSLYKEKGINYSGLEEKINNYNTAIRPFKTETLKNTSKTTNVYVISRYGYSAIPITPGWNALGDGVVDTKFSSFGATTALYGETLNSAEGVYVSPDETVDASTCLFPEQTWFIRDMKHENMSDCLDVLMENLMYYDGLATIETFEQYPQFLKYDNENDTLIIDEKPQQLTIFDIIKFAFFEIWNAIKSLFVKN